MYSAENLKALKGKLGELRDTMKNEDAFKEIYAFTYNYVKTEGQKSLGEPPPPPPRPVQISVHV